MVASLGSSRLPGDVAIRVENLGKRYRIGGRRVRRDETLRDLLVETVTKPIRQARRNGHDGADAADGDNAFWALRDVSFEIKRGETVGLIGRNGAGKTTALKILSRITEPTEGEALIRGRVGTLLEVGTGFHPELTGRENIFLSGAILGMKRSEIERKFDEIVAFSEIEKFMETPVKRYSTGMYVRLAFAVAAHLEPEILLVDEVLAVGDAAFQKKCLGKMGDVALEGRTVVFVSHNMAAISQLCRRAFWIEGGQLKLQGQAPSVVATYLESGTSAQPEWINSSTAAVQDEVNIKAARILLEGRPAGVIAFNQSFQMQIEYQVKSPTRSVAIITRLTDAQGNVALVSWDTDTTDWTQRVRERGNWSSTCDIPASLLKPGRYWLTVVAHLHKSRDLATYQNVLAFDVSPIGYPFNLDRLGSVTPLLNWHVGPA
jgi:lipopolysaccharide transport system ATP-binding protein